LESAAALRSTPGVRDAYDDDWPRDGREAAFALVRELARES
jgi:hypothetical protein